MACTGLLSSCSADGLWLVNNKIGPFAGKIAGLISPPRFFGRHRQTKHHFFDFKLFAGHGWGGGGGGGGGGKKGTPWGKKKD